MTNNDTFDITTLLSNGIHGSPGNDNGVDFLGAASSMACGDISNYPYYVCPFIDSFCRELNDRMPDDETRTRLLLPYAEKLLDTSASEEVEQKRSLLLADWSIRVIAPHALEKAGLREQAIKLRNLAPVVDSKTATQAREAAKAAAEAADNAYHDAVDAADAAAKAVYDAASAAAEYAASCAESVSYAAGTAVHYSADAAYAAARTAAAAAAADEDVWTQAAAMIGTLCEVTQ